MQLFKAQVKFYVLILCVCSKCIVQIFRHDYRVALASCEVVMST